MTRSVPGLRSVVTLGLLVGFLLAWQGTATAALDVRDATLDGVTSTSTPPGGVMRARVSAQATGGDRWRATSYAIGPDTICVNHADQEPGNRTVAFDVTAPGAPGAYDATFRAWATNSCGGVSGSLVLEDAVTVTAPGPNPDLPPRCGIDVMLVLDESGSIASSGATESVRDASRAFLTALSGTGASVSIVDFSTTAARPVGYTTVTEESIDDVFEPYLRDGYRPNGWTNWEDAFAAVRAANTQGPVADLVVFMTDGDPTARDDPPRPPVTGLTPGEAEALRRAALQADLVKGQGSHVLALGVGSAVTTPSSARRLSAVSGFDQLPPSQFEQADFTLVEDFDDLADTLRQIVVALCRPSVTVTKQVDEGDGSYVPDPGWEFQARVGTQPGGWSWVQPPPASGQGARTAVTDDDGVVTFQWKPVDATASSGVVVTESPQPGYELVGWECRVGGAAGGERVTTGTTTAFGLRIGADEYATCTVRNRVLPGTIEIEKQATPGGAQPFAFTGTLGAFDLVDDGGGTASSRVVTGLAPGTYGVAETVPPGWTLDGITCRGGTTSVAGAGATIVLGAGDAVVCTFVNRRDDVPEPVVPPTVPGTGEPVPPDPVPPTRITVVKTAPRISWTGQVERFSITVRNVGTQPATGVVVADHPPAALRLSGFRSRPRARVLRGTAVWRLGTLQPGQSRTIRGRVRIETSTPGLKRNHALATAVNAELVTDVADTRIVRIRAVRPAVTG